MKTSEKPRFIMKTKKHEFNVFERDIGRFWGYVSKGSHCWTWTGHKNELGYGMIGLGGAGMVAVHRFSFFLHGGKLSTERPNVLHSCDNRGCVNPAHLRAGSQAENIQEMAAKGRGNRAHGERHPKAKLDAQSVVSIRELYAAGGITMEVLAARFNVSECAIRAIIINKTWRHILPVRKES